MNKSIIFLPLLFTTFQAVSAQWEKIIDEKELSQLFSDTTMEATLADGVNSTAVFNSDGTGEVSAWGDKFQREWKIENNKACVKINNIFECFTIEKYLQGSNANSAKASPSAIEKKAKKYRITHTQTGAVNTITITDITDDNTQKKVIVDNNKATDRGGATKPSAEELAAKLSNPTSPVMTIGNNIDIVYFDGDIEGASEQSATRYVFQTVFPFKLKNNNGVVFFRPTIPVLFNDPLPTGNGKFETQDLNLGDIGFDLSWGTTEKSGLIWGGGMIVTLPTATEETLGKDLWAAGPEILLGSIGKWGTAGALLSHQWDFAGSGNAEINSTSAAYWYAFPLGGGWQFAAGPNITYDHTKDSKNALSLPVGVGLAKTSVLFGRPWKFHVQYWNYVERDENFSAEHQLRISISPVVSAPWNK